MEEVNKWKDGSFLGEKYTTITSPISMIAALQLFHIMPIYYLKVVIITLIFEK